MSIKDSKKLLKSQYKDSDKLNDRILLHNYFSTNSYGWHKWVFDQLLDICGKNRILELGCGNGALCFKNIERVPNEWQVILSDFSPGMLKKVKESLGAKTEFVFENIDAQSIPYGDNSFDVIIANHMLYHVPDLDKALSEIRRVLTDDGFLFCSTVGLENMKEMRELLLEFDVDFTLGTAQKVFGLENGRERMLPYFEKVERRLYHDSLNITEPEPLVDYILTFSGMGNIEQVVCEHKAEFEDFIVGKIRDNGSIKITKSAGIFVAR